MENEGAAIWLSRRLKELGIALPAEPQAQLDKAAKRGLAHALRVDGETATSLATLRAVGIEAVPLKAAAMRRLTARVPYADARAPNDLDLLVREADARRAFDTLLAKGYHVQKDTNPPEHHHLPPIAGPLGIAVELHSSTAPEVTPDEAWFRATREPRDTELLWHAASHAVFDINDHAAKGTRLRNWIDAAALLSARAPIDWALIRGRLDSGESAQPDSVRAWLRTAAWLGGVTLERDALGRDGPAMDLGRLIAWRLHVIRQHGRESRWARRLLEESARGESLLPVEPANTEATTGARLRHVIGARAARMWWMIARRQ